MESLFPFIGGQVKLCHFLAQVGNVRPRLVEVVEVKVNLCLCAYFFLDFLYLSCGFAIAVNLFFNPLLGIKDGIALIYFLGNLRINGIGLGVLSLLA